MDNIFSGLEDLGFKDLNKVDLYEKDNPDPSKIVKAKKGASPEEILYDKSYDCPACGNNFKSKTVRTGKARIATYDTDFMPVYQDFNAMLYEVVICPKCGYASLNKYFERLKQDQILLINSIITPKFKGKTYPDILNVDLAIEQFKLALLNTVVKKGRNSEKAYTCLKLAWLYRMNKDSANERAFMDQAFIGFREAFEKEPYPICGMDVNTLAYMLGELARRLNKNDEALKWLGRVIVTPNISPKLKEKARDMKDLITE